MKIFLALLIILFLTFSGYHLSFRGFRLPFFARKIYLSGLEFLFLGLLLGSQFLNILDRDTLQRIQPFSALILGWIGLLFGFQFEIDKMRRFPRDAFLGALIESLLTFGVTFFGIQWLFPVYLTGYGFLGLAATLALSATAACTAQTWLALIGSDTQSQSKGTLRLLKFMSSIDSLIALLIFSLAFLLRPNAYVDGYWFPGPWQSIVVIFGVCVGLFLLHALLVTRYREENELLLIVIGMAVLASGTASAFNFSPLLCNFFVGFCLVNVSRQKERIYAILIQIEKPIYLLLLVLLGAEWELNSIHLFWGAAVLCLLRLIGKIGGGFLVTQLNAKLREHPPMLGLGLLDLGGLPLAIVYDFQQAFYSQTTIYLTGLVLLAIIYNDILSPHLLEKLLKKGRIG